VATITPEDNAPPFRDVAPAPQPVAQPAPMPPPTPQPQTLAFLPDAPPAPPAPPTGERGAAAPAAPQNAATLPGAASAGAPRPGPAGAPALDLHALLERLRPWALKYRIALFSAGALFALAIFLGVLLGNLRHPAAPSLAPVATAGATPPPGAPAPVESRAPVSFRVSPWGEIYVDGKPTGVAPPLARIELGEGHHRIDVHHESSPVWSVDVDVHGSTPIQIEHQFP
jgi:hypothetical protein